MSLVSLQNLLCLIPCLVIVLVLCHWFKVWLLTYSFTGAPEVLRKRFPFSVTLIAHRGGSLVGPENTLFTFMKSVEGADIDMLELDVHLSSDKQIVVSHDDCLQRTCGDLHMETYVKNIVVGEHPESSLPKCHHTIPLFFKTQDKKVYCADEEVLESILSRVCLLREVFEHFPNTPLHIDVKAVSKECVYKVLELIAEYKRENITFVGTSVNDNAKYFDQFFRECHPDTRNEYRLFATEKWFFLTYIFYYLGILSFIDIPYDVFSIPIFTKNMSKDVREERGNVVGCIATWLFTSPTLWRYLQQRGICVIGWVVNEYDDFTQALHWPLNGIMTDDPFALKQYITAHGDECKLIELKSKRL